jgi:hypothetical protein
VRKHFPDIPRTLAGTDTKPDAGADTRADARTNPDADTHANAVAVPGPCECRDNDRTQPGDHDERYGRGLF